MRAIVARKNVAEIGAATLILRVEKKYEDV